MNPNADRMKYAIQITLLILVTITAFSNIMSNQFVWDDNNLIIENPYVQNLKNVPYFFTAHYWNFSHPASKGGYRPLFMASLALDYSLWGPNAFGFHLTSMALHLANVLLVFFLMTLLMKRSGSGEWFSEAPFIAALLFAVHPVHVESVTYIKSRGELLACVFFLTALVLFIRNIPRKSLRENAAAISVSISCFILALLSKEIAITLPLVLLLYCLYVLPAGERLTGVLKTLPYFAVTALYVILKFQILVGQMILRGSQKIGAYSNALVILKTLAYYVCMMAYPLKLNAERKLPLPRYFLAPRILFSVALLAAIIAAIMILRKRGKLLGFALIWMLVTLLPVSNIILLYPRAMAEQRLYLPSVGFCFALALVINRLSLPSLSSSLRKKTAVFCALCVICLTVFYMTLTMERNLDWRSPVAFWTKTSQIAPYKDRAYFNLGAAYFNKGKYAEAIEPLKKAIAINPDHGEAYYDLGNAYYMEKLYDEAIACLKKAIEINPKNVYAYRDLNVVYQATGRTGEAVDFYRKMLRVYPKDGEVCNNLAVIYEENLGKHEDAIELYKKAISLGLNTEIVYYNLGVAYDSLNREEEAMEAYKKSVKLKPDFASAYNNIAAIYFRQGKRDLAVQYDAKAKRLKESNKGSMVQP